MSYLSNVSDDEFPIDDRGSFNKTFERTTRLPTMVSVSVRVYMELDNLTRCAAIRLGDGARKPENDEKPEETSDTWSKYDNVHEKVREIYPNFKSVLSNNGTKVESYESVEDVIKKLQENKSFCINNGGFNFYRDLEFLAVFPEVGNINFMF
ncbi:hypothetical protein COEREDRAFT_89461 [Coemansia reversa NRRL 1564]|uniref:Uncharacterized protein n=1 Tax=Coemansia reversa (strain ATCC 12441 / NRRL 1564) TaxID=763665 RepID=A0A2G5B4E0_COERN|nr:hypothetical protein COEREDRAFT_89461 [Coemansia reversa NRRL 1564]|eukprot:PIA13597.1 hypothetical protein COEREDRAFT_89461 [Coemansia reversa NRRL 1564]